ncbi:hypothetical protein HUG15_14770 [Salicibibacter cibarius]|uniref:Copper resistance protein D domain-containing protein n=1 Tax=Salicibibacter cibarius TaxID=2743000 RepID=A0A7T6Z4K5_9BACI|nr:hypothetical protein [Salicibibacter cibarius]QQK76703.1 hypothetical protein HUG15_14770 [Salicibibacter cibarius]
MSWTLYQSVLWAHIFLAIIWVGGLLFIGWGVFPAVKTLVVREQRQTLAVILKHSHHFFTLAGAGVIVTGTALGTVLGPVQSWEALWHTTYGNLWFAALLIGIMTLFWGTFVGYRQAIKILSTEHLWTTAKNGYSRPLNHSLFALALLESVEGLGFVILLTLMIML